MRRKHWITASVTSSLLLNHIPRICKYLELHCHKTPKKIVIALWKILTQIHLSCENISASERRDIVEIYLFMDSELV